MGPEYGGGLGNSHPPTAATTTDGAYQPENDQPRITPTPSYVNGVFAPPQGRPPPGSPTLSAKSDGRKSLDRERERERNRSRTRGRTVSGNVRTCAKCGEALTGQFVRALDGTFHLDCFKCRDCGQIVASKFFPADNEEGGQYPLCETDYFRRLGLLCFQCGGALRGSYITALDRKYHVDHFTCSLCSTVFGAQDSYYEHDGHVYCHYHYSTQFAQRCNGCHTAILKQFVEIFRNGQNQHWHPECYMIHKFWNVRLTPASDTDPQIPEAVDAAGRESIKEREEQMEDKVYRIWSTLSTFEESSAACISDMLLHVSNGAYIEGVLVAKRFIIHVEILFQAADKLDESMKSHGMKGLSYSREAKLLCKKIVSFFSLLSKTQDTGSRKLGVTQELLSLVTGLAHYLKLLIRICLQGALKVEREHESTESLYQFLDGLAVIEAVKTEDTTLQISSGMAKLSANDSDQCTACRKPIEDECALNGERRWHSGCVTCERCGSELGKTLDQARLHPDLKIYCSNCDAQSGEMGLGLALERISKLQQYIFLLKVALARLLSLLKNSGALPTDPEKAGTSGYDAEGYPISGDASSAVRSDSQNRAYADGEQDRHRRESSYESTLNDVRRLRSTRLDKHLSSSLRKARTSRIMDGPEGRSVRPGSSGADHGGPGNRAFQIEEDREPNGQGTTEQYFGHNDALTLDDIPRIVAVEQAREKQSEVRQSRHELLRSPATHLGHGPPPAIGAGSDLRHARSASDGRGDEMKLYPQPSAQRLGRKFFSELSGLEYFIVRHMAVLTMHPLLESEFTLEELLGLIEARKPATFWNKFGKAFKNKDTQKNVKKKGVFGLPIEAIVERDGADSTDGVGPGALRIPAIVEDTITALKNKDLSVEGVFRKNGNIKKLSEQVAAVDREGCDAIRWNDETPHQLAALLKRYLRELPDPLMTNKLYHLWVVATKIKDSEKRKQCLHLACCLLPQTNRDTLEVLFNFLKWTATFHQVDEEVGSRMDVHNLARVIAPNILSTNTKSPSFSDEPMVAVACVEDLIQYNEEMCMVPDELMDVLGDSSLFNHSGDITTKEILKRIGERSAGGARQYDTELVNRYDNARPIATRVDTDPASWHQERSVRTVQEPTVPFVTPHGTPHGTPPQKHRALENGPPSHPSSYERSDSRPPHGENGQRREWRNSGMGRPNNSVAMGTG